MAVRLTLTSKSTTQRGDSVERKLAALYDDGKRRRHHEQVWRALECERNYEKSYFPFDVDSGRTESWRSWCMTFDETVEEIRRSPSRPRLLLSRAAVVSDCFEPFVSVFFSVLVYAIDAVRVSRPLARDKTRVLGHGETWRRKISYTCHECPQTVIANVTKTKRPTGWFCGHRATRVSEIRDHENNYYLNENALSWTIYYYRIIN